MSNLEYELPKVNLEKSLRSKRLVLNSGRFNLYVAYFINIMLNFCFFALAINLYQYSFFIALPCLIASIWMFFNLLLLNKLVEIKGDGYKNEKIIKFICARYPYLKMFSENEQRVIQFYKLSGFFDKKNCNNFINRKRCYINIIKTGRNNGFSPFHGFVNYFDCKEIAKYFNKGS